jgi:hypothetical protein
VPCRSLWQALLLAGIAGWTPAIGIHPMIGYTDPIHLAPAIAGAALFFVGLACASSMLGRGRPANADDELATAKDSAYESGHD